MSKAMMVGIRVDTEAESAYVYVSGGSIYGTKDLGGGVCLDFDKEGCVVGVESINADMTLLQLQRILESHPDKKGAK